MNLFDITMRLFNSALIQDRPSTDLFKMVNEVSIRHGFIVTPEAASQELLDWFKSQPKPNFNSTFYEQWNDIIEKSRLELFVDQVLHYASTYGTDFQGEAYIPNDNPLDIPLKEYKVITAISKEEAFNRCEDLLKSGIALDSKTIDDIIILVYGLGFYLDPSIIKNKEVLMYVYKKENKLPSDPVEMVRYLVYRSTESTLLIKDKATIQKIKLSKYDVSELVQKYGIELLSSVFFRFKPIFLAFKSNQKNCNVINKLRKAAVKNHKPLQIGFFENILSINPPISEVTRKLDKINNFKKVQLLQSILVRLENTDTGVYIIRNGKLYVKSGKKQNINSEYLVSLFDVIYKHLVQSVSSKKCSVRLPKNLHLTAPTSAKNFIGNVPYGSYVNFRDTDNIVGIYWRYEDGANDIDLSMVNIDGEKIGWNSDYRNRNNSVIYSGDMTSADPEATELMYVAGNFRPAVVSANLYCGGDTPKFKMFIAQEEITDMQRGYMVDPNNIIFEFDIQFDTNSRQKALGIVTKNKFYFMDLNSGNGRVSSYSTWYKNFVQYTLDTAGCTILLEAVLRDAGFTFVEKDADIDLTNISKDQLINLFM